MEEYKKGEYYIFPTVETRENGLIAKVKFLRCKFDCWNLKESKTCKYFSCTKDKVDKQTNEITTLVQCKFKIQKK